MPKKLSAPGVGRRMAAPKPAKKSVRAPEKKPVTYRLPMRMKSALHAAVVRDGYGLKGKSRWVAEAVVDFLQDRSWRDQVLDVDMVKGNDEKDVVFVDADIKDAVLAATRQVVAYAAEMRAQGRRLENLDTLVVTQAAVMRAAIIWRLFNLRMPDLKVAGEFAF